MIKAYIEYLKDNPQGYWFKAKIFGWGWTPATKEGWLVLIGYLAAIALCAFSINEADTSARAVVTFVLPVLLLTATLLVICYKTGEPPHWQWGLPRKK